MANKLTHKVVISQGGVNATFRLSDKEMESLCASSWTRSNGKHMGNCYNFSMYAFFEYETTRSKYNRFARLFNYHKGDFFWYDKDWLEE